MAHIQLTHQNLPGIFSLLYYRQELSAPLISFTEVLLRGPSPLSIAEREIIASYTSSLNDCFFCHACHGAIAANLLNMDVTFIDEIRLKFPNADVSDKFRALLSIAECIQMSGHQVEQSVIDRARQVGATDLEIHDTVLISSAFCMFNRYVDGLDAPYPKELGAYMPIGKKLARDGYSLPVSMDVEVPMP